jgi:hypothetical protein
MRWVALVLAALITLIIAVHVAGLTFVAAAVTPLAGIILAALGVWVLKSRRDDGQG